MLSKLKQLVMRLFFSKGRVLRIWRGPLKGYRYIVKSDTGFSSLLGRWEKESQVVYMHSIFPGDVIFDLGANYGIHSMLFAKLTGPSGKVYSFEPLPNNIHDLEAHIRLNHVSNIEIVPTAICEKQGTLDFKLAAHAGQGSLIGIGCETGEVITVNTDTLDNFCTQKQVLPDFIKIDIEGAEGLALEGFENTIASCYPFLAIDLHNPECDRQVGAFLKKHGYEAYRVINGFARNERTYQQPLQQVKNLDETYPNPDGVWGVIWAIHPSRKSKVKNFINTHI